VRTITRAEWEVDAAEHRLWFTVEADGFLRCMVRNIVGTLVAVGLGRVDPAAVAEILASRDRRRAGATAPPQGLFLVSVEYDQG
jgi:tRNA pseudouridine38-40 synthase